MTGWAHLAASVLFILLAYNALQPVHRPAPFAVASFFASWLTAELAIHHLIAQTASSAILVAMGSATAWPGRIALLVSLVAACLLVVSHRRSSRAGEAMREALAAIGLHHHDEPMPWLDMALPFPVRSRDVEITRNVRFHDKLTLDVFRPRAGARRAPVFVYVHGGAWMIGHRRYQGLPLLLHLAARGWVCFSVDYRLSPRATFPDHLVDVKRALAWIKEHARELGGDPEFVVIGGNSAGAHLSSLAALTSNDPEYQPGFEGADTRVSGCVGFYGVYDLCDRHGHWRGDGMKMLLERHVMKCPRDSSRDAYAKGSPIDRVHGGAPPFLIVHGDRDCLTPVDEARRFVDALRAAGTPVAYAEIPGAQHAFEIFPSIRTARVVPGVARFLGHLYGLYCEAPRPRTLRRAAPIEQQQPHL